MRTLLSLLLLLAACTTQLGAPPEPPLPYRQGEDAFRLGDYGRAIRGYRAFLDTKPHEDLAARAYYKMALGEFRRGGYEETLEILDEMQKELPDDRWAQVYALRGDAEDARGNTISALHWWEEAWLIAEPEQKEKLQQRVKTALDQLPRPALESARSVFTAPEMRARAELRLRDLEAGAPEPSPPPGRAAVPLGSAGASPKVPAGAKPRIACLLPLSGPYAAYGQRSLNGIRLAIDPQQVELVVRDEAGEAHKARAALDELIADPAVLAVIGPLRSEVAEVIAPRAERAGLVMALLSQRSGIQGRYVLQLALTPARQADALARYAVDRLGLSRFAMVHPSDGYGQTLAEAFQKAVIARESKVVGALAYTPGARQFDIEALTVQQWRDQDGVQAVFVPDSAEVITVLAPQLRRVVPDLVLLGSDGWHDRSRLGHAADALEGAVFVDGFFAGSRRPATRDFVSLFESKQHTAPGILEAQAYDAVSLLQKAVEAGARSRSGVLTRLAAMGPIEGASGRIGVGPEGIEREIFVLQLVGGTIQEVGRAQNVAHREAVNETAVPEPAHH